MFWNYLKVAYRNLLRHPLYAAINVVGLGIAIAFCVLAFLYVRYEWTYDGFHENADRIYRVYAEFENGRPSEVTPRALGPALSEAVPDVRYVRMNLLPRIIQHRGQTTNESFIHADPAILEVFSLPMIKGDPFTALADPDYVVITDAMAKKYFPGQDPIGKTISVQDIEVTVIRAAAVSGVSVFSLGPPARTAESKREDPDKRPTQKLTVTGVIEDTPKNSTIRFDFLSALNPAVQKPKWIASSVETYVMLTGNLSPLEAERRLHELSIPWLRSLSPEKLKLQPLRDIYFDSGHIGLNVKGNPVYSYLLGGIAILVLIVAVVNFANLSVGRSFSRVREVGIRKVAGCLRPQLARQFLAESVLLTAVALALGLALAESLMPGFNSLINREFTLSDLADRTSLVFLVVMVLGVGIFAGGYPAIYMSGFLPADALKGRFKVDRMGLFSRALLVFQLAISTALVTCMTVAAIQMNILKRKPLGFEASHIVVVRLFGILEKTGLAKTFEEATWRYHSVMNTTRTSHGLSNSIRNYTRLSWMETSMEGVERIRCDKRFLETTGIKLLVGRDFERESDAKTSAIVNESLARKLGWQAPLGETIRLDRKNLTVIGVVRDFHFRSLHHAIGPAVMQLQATSSSTRPRSDSRYLLMIRIRPDNVHDTLDFLKQKWREVVPDKPFDYYFLDEDIDRQYREELRWFKIAGYTTFFAVFIACLGAFGLTSLTVARRTKEIGIRKVLGAPTLRIVSLLTREYVALVGIATLIASPVTYVAAEHWLQNFAYRVDPGIGTFLTGGVLTLLVVLLAVSLQVARAARANPVDALRYE